MKSYAQAEFGAHFYLEVVAELRNKLGVAV